MIKLSLTQMEAAALDDALYAWRERLSERGVFKAVSQGSSPGNVRREAAYRHDNVVISYVRTAPTIEVK